MVQHSSRGQANDSVAERIFAFNAGRRPNILVKKYEALRSDPFTFLRGTCHLFYEDWPSDSPLNAAPPAWISGDLHIENFGSYKGDNRVVYFDIGDFDEGVLAPCVWEVARLLTSILVADRPLKVCHAEALSLCHTCLSAYVGELAKGHPRALDRAEAVGLVKDLLVRLKRRERSDFLDERTKLKKRRRTCASTAPVRWRSRRTSVLASKRPFLVGPPPNRTPDSSRSSTWPFGSPVPAASAWTAICSSSKAGARPTEISCWT